MSMIDRLSRMRAKNSTVGRRNAISIKYISNETITLEFSSGKQTKGSRMNEHDVYEQTKQTHYPAHYSDPEILDNARNAHTSRSERAFVAKYAKIQND